MRRLWLNLRNGAKEGREKSKVQISIWIFSQILFSFTSFFFLVSLASCRNSPQLPDRYDWKYQEEARRQNAIVHNPYALKVRFWARKERTCKILKKRKKPHLSFLIGFALFQNVFAIESPLAQRLRQLRSRAFLSTETGIKNFEAQTLVKATSHFTKVFSFFLFLFSFVLLIFSLSLKLLFSC